MIDRKNIRIDYEIRFVTVTDFCTMVKTKKATISIPHT